MPAPSLAAVLAALDFAALKHRDQRRKDADASPYVNHLIAVTRILADEGAATSEPVLVAAALHDTVEDTETTFEELEQSFGPAIAGLVREVTDDKSLSKQVRKESQIAKAPQVSDGANRGRRFVLDVMFHLGPGVLEDGSCLDLCYETTVSVPRRRDGADNGPYIASAPR